MDREEDNSSTPSHWDRLPPEMKDYIEDLAARQIHRERLQQVCDDPLWIDRCFVCGEEEWGLPLTPFCEKPAHFQCCTAPLHVQPGLRPICLILDFDGYMLSNGTFMIREAGWCDMKGHANSLHFELPMSYKSLSVKDRRTVNYVYRHIHALPFDARPEENAVDMDLAEFMIKLLYEKHCTYDKHLVAYKGGHVEKDMLTKLKIPHIDLEFYDCPKANQLLMKGSKSIPDCGHHMHAHTHCPRVESFLFWQWLTEHP